MFADDCPFDKIGMDVIECDAHRTINRRMAEESVVLLKNDGILPLKKEIKKLAVIGPNADDVSVLLGNYNGYPSRYSTFLRGLQDAFDGEIIYSKGCHPFIDAVANPWMEDLTREAVLAAKRADAVVMFLGLNPSMEGEEGDAFTVQMAAIRLTFSCRFPRNGCGRRYAALVNRSSLSMYPVRRLICVTRTSMRLL